MARCCKTLSVDDYVLDVLMRDLIGHDQKPAAFGFTCTSTARPHETNGAALAPVRAQSPTQQGSPKAPSTRRSYICGADNLSRRPLITSLLLRAIAFFATGARDRVGRPLRWASHSQRAEDCPPYLAFLLPSYVFSDPFAHTAAGITWADAVASNACSPWRVLSGVFHGC